MQKELNPPARGGLRTGVLLLTVSNLVVKVLGFAYKVPLNALLGDEMANVNAACALFAVLYTATAAGIPGALALSLSRARAAGDRARLFALYDTTMTLLLSVGLVLSVLIFLFSGPFAPQGAELGARLTTAAIAPALFFSAATGALRGFFQGFSLLTPTAVSGLLEGLGKTIFGVLLALVALRAFEKSTATAAALAVFGITLGVAAGTVFLAVRYRKEGGALLLTVGERGESAPPSRPRALLSVLKIALPITLSAVFMSLSSFLDARLMRPLLTEYLGDAAKAKSLYSDYSTGAVTLYNLPLVLVTPLATGLVPYVSGAFASGREDRARGVTASALKLSLLLALPCALGLAAFASPVLAFVFRADGDMVQNAGPSLAVLAPCVVLSSLLTVSSAVLQAIRRERAPILSLGLAVLVKLVAMPPLVRSLGALGVPASTLAFYLVAALLNLVFLFRHGMLRISLWDAFLRPLLCAALAVLLSRTTYVGLLAHLGADTALLLSLFLSLAIYFSALLLTRAVGAEELSLLPFGRRLAEWLPRRGQ
jgi:stage V sporulation protein B